MAEQQTGTPSQQIRRGRVHEGPRNHVIAFAMSVVLTALAFLAVMNPNLSSTFKYSFIVILAFIQVILQLAFWMHMKDRGHFFARVFLAMGVIVGLLLPITAIYWTWW